MNKVNKISKKQVSAHSITYWVVGILLILTVLTTGLLSGLLAKYTRYGDNSSSAEVAAAGSVKLLEHKATLNNGIYELNDSKETEVTSNTYEKVIPGVDIAKDPFVRLDLTKSEVDYELYVKVIEEKFPTYQPTADSKPKKTVTYKLTEDWIIQNELSNAEKGIYVYKYKDVLNVGATFDDIKILKDDKLYVSEHYQGKGNNFKLRFEAWIEQLD